jgi:hypothetical protein
VRIFLYVTNPKTERVHITDDSPSTMPERYTACGQRVQPDWTSGDETLTGIAATCDTCRTRGRLMPDSRVGGKAFMCGECLTEWPTLRKAESCHHARLMGHPVWDLSEPSDREVALKARKGQ